MSTIRFRGRTKPPQCLPVRRDRRPPIARRVLSVKCHAFDAATKRSWVQLSFLKLDGKRRTVLVPREQATRPNDLSALLASMGAILPARAIASLCQEILEDKAAKLVRLVSRAGWAGSSFVVLDGRVIAGAKGLLVVPPEQRLPPGPATVGSLAVWSRDVADPASHSSRLMLVIALAFSAPLLHLTKGANGIINLCGRSTSGKSSALLVGNSVFWSGQRNRLLTWDATSTGVQQLASEHCDSLLCLDETQRKSLNRGKAAQAVYEAAFDLESGVGRVVDKNYRAKALLWRIVVLSSSEHPMFTNADDMDGGRVRIFDIPAVVHVTNGIFETLPQGIADSRTLMQSIEAASEANFGHAGRKFVAELVCGRVKWLTRIECWRNDFLQKVGVLNASWDARFTARFAAPFGLAYAAARAATEMGIVPWKSEHLRTAIVSCCCDAAAGSVAPVLDVAAAMTKVQNKLSNREIVFDLRDRPELDASKQRKACGFIVSRGGLSMHVIKPKAFVRWCGDEAMATALLNQLRQAGRLVASGNPRTPCKQVLIPGIAGRRRYVCLRYPLVDAVANAA